MHRDLARLRTEGPHHVESRLRRSAQHDCGAIAKRELLKHCQRKRQQTVGKRLGLVENNDAVRNAVDLAALAGLVGEERLKELDVRRHYNGSIPILSSKSLSVAFLVIQVGEVVIRMMLEDIF